jgi:hypothetical protein
MILSIKLKKICSPRLKKILLIILMSIELVPLEPSENVNIEDSEIPSWLSENKCALLFLFTAILGFIWVFLNIYL